MKSRGRRACLLVGWMAVCASGVSRADTLVLQDGRQLSGTVTRTDDGYEIRMKAGVVKVPLYDVARWEKVAVVATPPVIATPVTGTPMTPGPGAGAGGTSTVSRPLSTPEQQHARQRVAQLIMQGLVALRAQEPRAAIENFTDARSVCSKAHLVIDANDPQMLAMIEGTGVAHMMLQRYDLAGESILRAAASPIRGRSTVANQAILDLVQHNVPMRAVKEIKIYLTAHPQPDEMLLNVLGASLAAATTLDHRLQKSELYKSSGLFYEEKNKELEAARPGMRRWGMEWLDDFSATRKFKTLDAGRIAYNNAEADREAAAQYVGSCESAFRRAQEGGPGAGSASQAASELAKAKQRLVVASAQEKAAWQAIPWPAWPERMTPLLPDLAASLEEPKPTVAMVTPQPTPSGTLPLPSIPTPNIPAPSEAPTPPADPVVSTPVVSAPTPEPTRPRRLVTRQAVAVPVGPDLVVTVAAIVDHAQKLELEDSGGASFTAELVRTDAATGLALLRVSSRKLRYLNVARQFAGGEVQCWGYPEVSIFNAASSSVSGNATPPKADWKVTLTKHPRLTGAAIVDKAGTLIGITLSERDTLPSAMPVVTSEQLRTFLGDDLPKTACPNPDPAGVLQLTASR